MIQAGLIIDSYLRFLMQLPNYGEDKWSKKYIFLYESRVEYQSNFTVVYRPWNS